MREAARRLFRFHAFRRLMSVVVLISIDAAALSAGVLASAYLAGAGGEVVIAYLPIVLAVGLALFAAQDLYDKALARRNPAAHAGAVMLWAGLLTIGSVVYPDSGFGLGGVLLAALLPLVVSGALRFFYELHEPARLQGVRVTAGEVDALNVQLQRDDAAVETIEVETEADRAAVPRRISGRRCRSWLAEPRPRADRRSSHLASYA